MRYKRLLSASIKLALTLTIIGYLIKSGRLNLHRLLAFVDAPQVLLSLLLVLLILIIPLAAVRWWLLLRAIEIRLPLRWAYLLTWIGNFFNTTLPGAVTGDLVKGYYVVKISRQEGKTRALLTLIIDRATGLFGLIVMAFFALLCNWPLILAQRKLQPLAIFITILFLLIMLFYALILFPFSEANDPFKRLLRKLPKSQFFLKIYDTFKTYQYHWKTLLATLLISILIQSLAAFLFFLVARMLGLENVDLPTQMFIMPIGLMTTALPIAPGGIGVGHVAFETLYLLIGVEGGADVFNLFIVTQLAVFLLGGIVYFTYSGEFKLPDTDEIEPIQP
jgi:glycosyltransferase 2 family protein